MKVDPRIQELARLRDCFRNRIRIRGLVRQLAFSPPIRLKPEEGGRTTKTTREEEIVASSEAAYVTEALKHDDVVGAIARSIDRAVDDRIKDRLSELDEINRRSRREAESRGCPVRDSH